MITIESFARRSGYSVDDLMGRMRGDKLCGARQIYWKMLSGGGMSASAIGRMFNRTHATIISGVKRINGLLESKDAFSVTLWNVANATISAKDEEFMFACIAELEESGYTHDEMIYVFRMAGEKYRELKKLEIRN